MRVLVACEISGVVRDAFRSRGHDAWSCDVLPSEFKRHIQRDIREVLNTRWWDWDLMIAHPPCTYLSNMGNCRIHEPGRLKNREDAMKFFMFLVKSKVPKIAIENPVGYPCRAYMKPDQVIQPYQFGHPESKRTCLWLKGLPLLFHTNVVEPNRKWDGKRWRTWVDRLPSSSPKRSVTFNGIADAMAEQWGSL